MRSSRAWLAPAVLALLVAAPRAHGAPAVLEGLFAAEAEGPDDRTSFPPMTRLYALSRSVSTAVVEGAPAEGRAARVLALGRLGRADEVALALKSDPHWWVRFAAATALPKASACEAGDGLERAATADPQWQVRVRAVQSLSELRSPGSVAVLAAGLEDRDEGVRAAAALGLADVGGGEALAVLQKALRVESDPLHRQLLSSAVRRVLSEDVPQPPACPPPLRVAKTPQNS